MSESSTPTPPSACAPPAVLAVEDSCRAAVLALVVPAGFWLVLSSVFGLVASIKMHGPGFLTGAACLSFGRMQPASLNALIYGFLVPSALGLALWLVARLGRTPLRLGPLAVAGAFTWHLGVVIGQWGLLAGDMTGHALLEMPGYASPILLTGYLLAGTAAMATYASRREARLYVSQWFLLVALLWFPWIYATASVLLVASPVRGAFQAVVSAWYGANLVGLCLGFYALAMLYYWVPKELNRPLHSEPMAMAAFWMFLVFSGWVAVPIHLPVPAWIPSVSTVFTVFTIVPLLAVVLNFRRTFRAAGVRGNPVLRLARWSVVALGVSGIMAIVLALPAAARVLSFTYFVPAQLMWGLYGFVGLALMAASLAIVPALLGEALPSRRLVSLQTTAAVAGIVLYGGSLAAAGWMQGRALNDPTIPFNDVLRVAMRAFRLGTVGELLMLLAGAAWLANLLWALARYARKALGPAWTEATRPMAGEATR